MLESSHRTTLPQRNKVADCLEALWFLLFPDHRPSDRDFLKGASAERLPEIEVSCRRELTLQIQRALAGVDDGPGRADSLAGEFMAKLPVIKQKLLQDARAAYERDPAASGVDEIILTYPGYLALMTYRLAHELSRSGVPLIPRMMTEYAHSLTGCDIHPDARIGEALFIDHATGVVIGQTAVIGDRVTIYQGVTLGSLSVKNRGDAKQRHPTIEDDVVLYSNATILGGETVIGARSVIGGSSWITYFVPPDSRVILAKPQTITTKTQKPIQYIPNWDI
ncbi:MAG TPA: serine O-acetyltransferase EpsC [bacterium]|nr:serine O-acetyltransferase EpsC [bacterium]